jgi:hypothetical protein
MVDGDPQQGSEVANALNSYSVCPMHFLVNVVGILFTSSLPTSLWVEFDNFCTTVKSWLFSFIMLEGGVEDEDEYEVSKDLLFAYLNSSTVL